MRISGMGLISGGSGEGQRCAVPTFDESWPLPGFCSGSARVRVESSQPSRQAQGQ